MIKMPASSTAGGKCFAIPDVCKTPSPAGPVPIPYPNLVDVPTAKDVADKVLFEKKEAVTKKSTMARSNGDEGGVAGGVKSSTFGDQVAFTSASSKVYAAGQKVTFVTATTGHNGSNTNAPPGVQIEPSQSKVLVAM